MPQASVRIGLEVLLDNPPPILAGSHFGLLMNQASVDSGLCYACHVLASQFPGQLALIFSPQHGLWCERQDNMIETGHSVYVPLGIPIHSLYSETRRPTADMLQGLDCRRSRLADQRPARHRCRPARRFHAGIASGDVLSRNGLPLDRSYTTTVALFACLRSLYVEQFT